MSNWSRRRCRHRWPSRSTAPSPSPSTRGSSTSSTKRADFASTRERGGIMMICDELGQIRPGFLADILLVDGSPLANVKILQDADKLLMIMKDGQFHKEFVPARAVRPHVA